MIEPVLLILLSVIFLGLGFWIGVYLGYRLADKELKNAYDSCQKTIIDACEDRVEKIGDAYNERMRVVRKEWEDALISVTTKHALANYHEVLSYNLEPGQKLENLLPTLDVNAILKSVQSVFEPGCQMHNRLMKSRLVLKFYDDELPEILR